MAIFPPPLVTLYLHSNNLWHELLPLITREPSFQGAKGRVHRSVKGVPALRVVEQDRCGHCRGVR